MQHPKMTTLVNFKNFLGAFFSLCALEIKKINGHPLQKTCRVLWRFFSVGALCAYFLFVGAIFILSYSVLPNIDAYRPNIEKLLSEQIKQSVHIGAIKAAWFGLNPQLSLHDVNIAAPNGEASLSLNKVEARLSWLSLFVGQLRFARIVIEEPDLAIKREANGQIFVAGFPLKPSENAEDTSNSTFGTWLLRQGKLRIINAKLSWQDDLRGAPLLALEQVNIGLDNFAGRHKFGFTANPPPQFAAKIDIRGNLKGADIEDISDNPGQIYAELAYADLAIWQQWMDYPIALQEGRGAVRAWLTTETNAAYTSTVDVAIENAKMQFAPELAALDVEALSGRFRANYNAQEMGFDAQIHELIASAPKSAKEALKGDANDKIHLKNTQLNAVLQSANSAQTDLKSDFAIDFKTRAGSAQISALDLGQLARLAAYLPLPKEISAPIAAYAPSGVIQNFTAKWNGAWQAYSLSAHFAQLSVNAKDDIPGFSNFSGDFSANEKEGKLAILSTKSTLELPTVFTESSLLLNDLAVNATWKMNNNEINVSLKEVVFKNDDVQGKASGSYVYTGKGAGQIDLTAKLENGNARAVWRYMPIVAGIDTQLWLKDALLSGTSPEASLVLKGNLDDFPLMEEKGGAYLIKVKADNVALDYGTGWPKIEGIFGELTFAKKGMAIKAHEGRILGAKVTNADIKIPDFDVPIPTLFVDGQVIGQTAEFLRFIEQSPVAESIDHFTDEMRAVGEGKLAISLEMPLDEKEIEQSKIAGEYQFTNNEVALNEAFPPLKNAQGKVQFTESSLQIPDINASFLGSPIKISGKTENASTEIKIAGDFNIENVKKELPEIASAPWLSAFSGQTKFQGELSLDKGNVDINFGSDLSGLGIQIPDLLTKNAVNTLPLRFLKKRITARNSDKRVRDQVDIRLGNIVNARLIRAKKDKNTKETSTERGAMALGIGAPLTLPESGIALAVNLPALNIDFLRRLISAPETKMATKESNAVKEKNEDKEDKESKINAFFPDKISLKTPKLTVFEQNFTSVNINANANIATPQNKLWRANVITQEAEGNLSFDTAQNKLSARIKRLHLSAAHQAQFTNLGKNAQTQTNINSLPALDLIVDDFSLDKNHFGKLELEARKNNRVWELSKIAIINPFGALNGQGFWFVGQNANETRLDFSLKSADVGKLLTELNHPEAMNKGVADLTGKLNWQGSPADFDLASLGGTMKLKVDKGQFVKLEPGVGKLLGLLSLQGLARRVTFDFRDVFSEGLAFDTITSDITIEKGIASTERLAIGAPAAQVFMKGEVDLARETQNLSINVQPELGGTAALGVALINPIAGAVTWLAHKAFSNPLNKIFSVDYRVTGSWSDPKIDKVGTTETPKLPTISNEIPPQELKPAKND